MKKRIRPEATQNENHRSEDPVAGRQLECVTGLRAHIITGGIDDPADSTPDSP